MTSQKTENLVTVPSTKFWMMLTVCAFLCLGSTLCAQALYAQAQDTQQKTTDEAPVTSQTSVANQNPARTTESHFRSGSSNVDTQRVEVLGTDGRYVPVSDTETETVQVDATTTRTIVRTYRWDGNGEKKLAQVSEEESKSTPTGDAHAVRTTSTSDVDGNLQVVSREVADTKKTSPEAQATKTTLYVADSNGGFTTARQTEESQKNNPDHTVQVRKTTRLPDANGGWQVDEQKEITIKDDGKDRTTEERTSRPDSEGGVSESSRTIHHETESPTGERIQTVETYSRDVPGVPSDGHLHPSQQTTTVQKKTSGGEITEQQIARPNPGNPSDGMQPATKTKYTVRYGSSGTQQTTTREARDPDGNFNVISVETRKSEQAAPSQPPAAAANKPQ